jgi:hypothetical protein
MGQCWYNLFEVSWFKLRDADLRRRVEGFGRNQAVLVRRLKSLRLSLG